MNSSAIGLLRVLLVVSVVAPAALFVIAAWLFYRSDMHAAELDLRRTSQVSREQAGRVFSGEQHIADRLNDLIRDMDAADIRRSELALHKEMARLDEQFPEVQNVLLIDRTGHLLASSAVYPVPSDVDLSDRDYFQAVIAGHATTTVGSLQSGSLLHTPIFGIGRPWQGPDGSVRGVIAVGVAPSFFEDFYRILLGEARGSSDGKIVTLVRADGRILVRYPPIAGTPPRAPESAAFFAALRADPQQGVYVSRSIVGPAPPTRIYAYSKVLDLPLYAVAGIDRKTIVAEWRATMASHLVFGVPATIALFAISWTALVRARREERALAQARHEVEMRKRAEATLLRAQRLEAVGQLTGGIAHDFNNLLTVVLGQAELLQRRATDPARVKAIAEHITMAAKRGSDITRQLLAFSRRQVLHPEVIDPNARLLAFKPLLDRTAQERVSVKLALAPDVGAIEVDPGQLEAAVLNLVGNARDAMPQGGQVSITTANVVLSPGESELPPGRYVRVAVTDTGTGMSGSIVARAFEPFFTTKEVGKGTGLGLSQVYGFAKQAGGEARIVTSVGAGTTVELLLPRASDTRPPVLPPAATAEADHALDEVVLVVEDDPGVLETVTEMLRDLGYATITAASGPQGLEILQGAERVDILFSDVMMPDGMDGVQLSTEAQRIRPGLRVLLTSGFVGSIAQDALDGAPVLSKPYDKAQLALRLRSLAPRQAQ